MEIEAIGSPDVMIIETGGININYTYESNKSIHARLQAYW